MAHSFNSVVQGLSQSLKLKVMMLIIPLGVSKTEINLTFQEIMCEIESPYKMNEGIGSSKKNV